jgi:hypothetical protein
VILIILTILKKKLKYWNPITYMLCIIYLTVILNHELFSSPDNSGIHNLLLYRINYYQVISHSCLRCDIWWLLLAYYQHHYHHYYYHIIITIIIIIFIYLFYFYLFIYYFFSHRSHYYHWYLRSLILYFLIGFYF